MKYLVSSFYVPTGSNKGFLGLSSPDLSAPDLEAFNAKLANACNELDAQGFEPAFVVPLNIGTKAVANGSQVWSLTRGAAVVGRRRDG